MAIDGGLLSGLGVVAAVVEAGNFIGAARVLGLTQSGVSRAVARLEQRVGLRLFDRTSRAVTLTDEGRRFYEEVAPLLAGIEDATAAVAGARTVVRGRLRVNVDAAFGHYVLSPHLGTFLARHPELELELVVRDRIGDLVAEGLDVAVRFGDPEPSGLIRLRLAYYRVVTCASPDYVARHGLPQHPSDLLHAAHECIRIREPFTGRFFEWEFQRGEEVLPVDVGGRLVVNDAGSLIGALLGGHGIGQPFEFAVRELLDAGRLVQLLPDWSDEHYPVHVYHRSREHPAAKVRAFLDFLQTLA
ncbi:LysR family transcriptional regulator [Melittangium boletus]|uniref:LysR family transcriptional regulator n=1 Tax=Melittangium boletus TaxID=83453 RepID=UPI003DA3CEBB